MMGFHVFMGGTMLADFMTVAFGCSLFLLCVVVARTEAGREIENFSPESKIPETAAAEILEDYIML
jgi:hypothetical protein